MVKNSYDGHCLEIIDKLSTNKLHKNEVGLIFNKQSKHAL